MANILIFNESDGSVVKYIPSAHTPDYSSRSDVLINPVLPSIDQKYMKVSGSDVLEMTQAEKDQVDADEAQAAADAQVADMLNISFEDMPLKLPGLAWYMIEQIGFTDLERRKVIRALADFNSFIQMGHIAMGVEELMATSAPGGVDATKWAALQAQVQQIITNAS